MKMKALLALTAVLSFGAAAAQGTTTTTATQAPSITDVPAGHWAKDAVDRLVQEGIILGFPDGTYRGNQNLTRYQAAIIIARVLDRVAQNGTAGISDETLTSLQNAVQELAADLAALGVRVSDLEENAATKEDIARIEERLESLNVPGGDGAAAGDLANQLTDLTTRVDELSSNYDTLRADVDDNASSIAALNDLTVLLNQDILSLQDRVSAIEAGYVERTEFDALGNRVTANETRLGALEQGRVGVSGVQFNIQYGQTGLIAGGTNFDVDRLTLNTPLGGAFGDADVTTADAGTTFSSSGAVFSVSVGNIVNTNTFKVSSATLGIGFSGLFTPVAGAGATPNAQDTTLYLNNATVNGTLGNSPFALTYQRRYSAFAFNPYFFQNDNTDGSHGYRRGVVLTANAVDLPLAPKLTVATGYGDVGGGVNSNYFGIKGDFNVGLGTLGLGYAQQNGVASGIGADFNLNAFGIGLTGAYVATIPSNATGFRNLDARDQAFYTNASFAVGPVALKADFRAIDPDYALASTGGLNTDDDQYPFAPDQVGYGVRGDVTFGIISLGAYYDTNRPYLSTITNVNRAGFGVNAGVNNFFRGFSLNASFENATLNGTQVTQVTSGEDGDFPNVVRNSVYRSAFGVSLTHNGAAANALIPGLNITASYLNFFDDTAGIRAYGLTNIQAYADYTANLGGVTFRPFARYRTYDTAAGSAYGTDFSTVKYGAQLSAPFTSLPLAPTVSGGVSNRITTPAAGAATTELYANANVGFGQFLTAGTTFSVGYSYYQGYNVPAVTVGSDNNAFNASVDPIYSGDTGTLNAVTTGTASGTVNGVYAQLGFSGFTASYGLFNLNTGGTTSTINGFKIGYNVRF
ncbi:S-layer homology domain-containing protein [Deinococcus pimensis]|uniref:S-layer homology domain-containing protein n=1 Tax=Deinococcus pimensis TaxID=309888 RepID=UPI0004849BFE|nr:S-layer homology domain-containing protein [Deinococcus pimensis]